MTGLDVAAWPCSVGILRRGILGVLCYQAHVRPNRPFFPLRLRRFLPCGIGPHMSRLRHLGWSQCSRGLTSRPPESCHHPCLGAFCWVLGYPEGSAAELLDGSWKLRHCAAVFTKQFLPWVLPKLGRGVGETRAVTSGDLLDCGGNFGKRVRLTRKTRPGAPSTVIPDPGHPTPRRWKRLRSPSSDGVGWVGGEEGGSEVGAPRSLFPRLGVG